ncbi:hypothetical protein P4O66_007675, partial [Electrophorus voltai]
PPNVKETLTNEGCLVERMKGKKGGKRSPPALLIPGHTPGNATGGVRECGPGGDSVESYRPTSGYRDWYNDVQYLKSDSVESYYPMERPSVILASLHTRTTGEESTDPPMEVEEVLHGDSLADSDVHSVVSGNDTIPYNNARGSTQEVSPRRRQASPRETPRVALSPFVSVAVSVSVPVSVVLIPVLPSSVLLALARVGSLGLPASPFGVRFITVLISGFFSLQNVMDQFNPGLRNLINLGKSYEKAVMAMSLAGKMYFDAVSKIGENAAISPVSRELGVVLMEISEVQRKVHLELEDNFRRFHREIIAELDRKTDLDVKYMTVSMESESHASPVFQKACLCLCMGRTLHPDCLESKAMIKCSTSSQATFKRYQMEHKMKQDSLDRSQADLKKLRRKSQGKNALKYESKENECLETLTHRQMDMQKFIADGCKEALLEEKRRFCFLVDKHCVFSYQIATFHDKAKDLLTEKLSSWHGKCSDINNVPESVMSMIEGLNTPISITPQASPAMKHHSRNNSEAIITPPAPPLKAQTSPLVNMFAKETPKPEHVTDHNSEESGLARSVSMATGLNNVGRRPRVKTIFPHKSGSKDNLLSFEEGDIITLLIPDEKDGWLYGELEKTRQRGWFPSSYCCPYVEPVINNSVVGNLPVRSKSVANLLQQDNEENTMVLPPPDYRDSSVIRNSAKSLTYTYTPPSENKVPQSNGIAKPPFLGGGNPFATVKLRPTVTNDRSAPVI